MYYYRGEKYCTMKKTKHMFRRWPKLVDLHKKLFHQTPSDLHNSLIDVYVCFRCFCKVYYDVDILDQVKNNDNNMKEIKEILFTLEELKYSILIKNCFFFDDNNETNEEIQLIKGCYKELNKLHSIIHYIDVHNITDEMIEKQNNILYFELKKKNKYI